jgi:hypothetical protein
MLSRLYAPPTKMHARANTESLSVADAARKVLAELKVDAKTRREYAVSLGGFLMDVAPLTDGTTRASVYIYVCVCVCICVIPV